MMVIQLREDTKADTHLLLLQVVADGKVPVTRLALRLEPGTLARTYTHAQHVASRLTGLPKS